MDPAQLKRWAERLANLTVSPLPCDYPEISLTALEYASRPIEACQSIELSHNAQNALRQLQAKESRADSTFTVLISALVVLVSRLTGDENVVLGTSDRDGTPFVLTTTVDSKESFASLLARVQNNFSELAADVVPIDQLSVELKRPIVYQVGLYNLITARPRESLFTALDASHLLLYLSNEEKKGDQHSLPRIDAIYNQRLFSSSRISFLLAQLVQLLENTALDSQQCVGKIDLMTETQSKLLPDPTQDLHWSNFRGAIHDIFASNAEKHPERLCVVETASGSTPQRTFTYKQIHQASNILAHHLVQSGIQRGEIVMIYAYRGVDLVIAVMGVLKAGATFSVIDPLYPPDRQIIYLEVAQPRALINLEKATQDAGELSEKVRSFIKGSLLLRAEIPALAIRDDGSLVGGEIDGIDVLQPQQEMRTKSTNIVIGPDDIPTLSFTSGSEGRPKGVRGRHFSLAYYFPWMAQRFNLRENDRITMLSGIAHDPIQRDIFTPLFLGAQLLVPSKDDIQNEKLAEWMQKYEATVTHLTPAMGQILVGNATSQFPKLHHSFFVGDILIKRDCRSLQRLAPNVRIVNMWGTTETQRAVSYYEIPSYNDDSTWLEKVKDVIPVGKGMSDDVQLLVVNRVDPTKLCGIGEVGEIYIRAGGLSEGYLGQHELTEAKFRQNWFIDPQKWMDGYQASQGPEKATWKQFYRGPRDRLYKSGDLGRYTPSGDVECSGRADDQVKIRGFRVELGEIDTHLSKHPLIRENVTLVRKDKDQEASLVSYVVPQINAWSSWLKEHQLDDQPELEGMAGLLKRFRYLRDDARDYLKTKLPVYAVPSTIIPLVKMPLNPNGKIDKPALPFPNVSELAAAATRRLSKSSSEFSETEKKLAAIWAGLLRVEEQAISTDDSFFDLGGDSLKGNKMVFEVRKTWRVEISMSAIFRSPTLRDFALLIDTLINPDMLGGNGFDGSATDGVKKSSGQHEEEYAADAKKLIEDLPQEFISRGTSDISQSCTVMLTGATGFLGSYIIRDLLSRQPLINIVAHVRGKSPDIAKSRIMETCRAYGVWDPDWASRIRCVVGNLGDPKLGLADEIWEELSHSVDVVVHNGALVHWVYPYSKLKAPNVQGTIDALSLCAAGRPKSFVFVSSTSVLDNDYYVNLSDRLSMEGRPGIPESDDLDGSSTGLGIGYGQVKWVSEFLVREAGKRGLRGAIVRPGYVSGDSQKGVTNTDDFLIRMLKGCIQLSARPDINNTINMCPVDFVARLVVAAALKPSTSLEVMQCTSHPRLRFNEYLGMLQTCGYNVPKIDYIPWRASLENYVAQDSPSKETQHALLPLYHFVTADLPTSTKSPSLDDANALAAIRADADENPALYTSPNTKDWIHGSAVDLVIMKKYLAWLVAVGFLPRPSLGGEEGGEGGEGEEGEEWLGIEMGMEQREALGRVGGRGGS